MRGVWVPQSLGCVYWVSLRTCSTEFQDTEFQSFSLARINQTLQRSNMCGIGFLWLGDNPNSHHASLSFLYFPVSFTYAVSNLGKKHSGGNINKCVFHYTVLSHLYRKTFLYTEGSKSTAVTAKIKFLIGVIWEKNNKWWYHTHTWTRTHTFTHEVDWKLDFPNLLMFSFVMFFLPSF